MIDPGIIPSLAILSRRWNVSKCSFVQVFIAFTPPRKSIDHKIINFRGGGQNNAKVDAKAPLSLPKRVSPCSKNHSYVQAVGARSWTPPEDAQKKKKKETRRLLRPDLFSP
jgi:hypothetical protein